MNRYFTVPATSPRPDDVPRPVALKRTSPLAFSTQERPSSSTFTIGTATPMSRVSVTPTMPDITSVVDDNTRLVSPDRVNSGVVAFVNPSFMLSSDRSPSRS